MVSLQVPPSVGSRVHQDCFPFCCSVAVAVVAAAAAAAVVVVGVEVGVGVGVGVVVAVAVVRGGSCSNGRSITISGTPAERLDLGCQRQKIYCTDPNLHLPHVTIAPYPNNFFEKDWKCSKQAMAESTGLLLRRLI